MSYPKQIRVVACLIVLILASIGVGMRLYKLRRLNQYAKSEYTTVDTIHLMIRFIENHDGRWPTSWAELQPRPEVTDLVNIDFTVTSEEILRDRNLLNRALSPRTGNWHIYPHSKYELDTLWDAIKKTRTP